MRIKTKFIVYFLLGVLIIIINYFLFFNNLEKSNDIFSIQSNIKKIEYHDKGLNLNNLQLVYQIEEELFFPLCITTDHYGRQYILDKVSQKIKVFSNQGEYLTCFGSKGSGPGESLNISSINVDKNTIYLLDQQTQRIKKYSTKGELIWDKKIESDNSLYFNHIKAKSESIYISGVISYHHYNFENQSIGLCRKYDQDLNFIDQYFDLNKNFLKNLNTKSKDGIKNIINKTINMLAIDKFDNIYLAKLLGKNLIYKFDQKKNKYVFKFVHNPKQEDSVIMEKKRGFGLKSNVNLSSFTCFDDLIFLLEGPFKRKDIKYAQKITIFDSSGKYLDSFWDKKLHFDKYGYRMSIHKNHNNYEIFLISPERGKLYKYILNEVYFVENKLNNILFNTKSYL
ncbi:MAG: 6-bladed beta-propeller [Candidatus Cloacimonetes bacterium]|nr:6-bladed beta-propeller [Candidatus Cloacimonadota bacterium]MBS3768191.1 6-bladed beta-propeller [Candidatus Cloacimonadota bacterium]